MTRTPSEKWGGSQRDEGGNERGRGWEGHGAWKKGLQHGSPFFFKHFGATPDVVRKRGKKGVTHTKDEVGGRHGEQSEGEWRKIRA